MKNNVKGEVAVPNTAISGNGTTDGNIIDTKDFGSLTFFLTAGTLTDGTYTPVIKESDDPAMAGETEVADDFLIGTEADAALSVSDTVKTIGYVGHKRYVTCDIVASGVTTGGNVSATAVKGDAQDAPVSQ